MLSIGPKEGRGLLTGGQSGEGERRGSEGVFDLLVTVLGESLDCMAARAGVKKIILKLTVWVIFEQSMQIN